MSERPSKKLKVSYHLLDFPQAILLRLLTVCDMRTTARFIQTCKQIRDVAKDQTLWQDKLFHQLTSWSCQTIISAMDPCFAKGCIVWPDGSVDHPDSLQDDQTSESEMLDDEYETSGSSEDEEEDSSDEETPEALESDPKTKIDDSPSSSSTATTDLPKEFKRPASTTASESSSAAATPTSEQESPGTKSGEESPSLAEAFPSVEYSRAKPTGAGKNWKLICKYWWLAKKLAPKIVFGDGGYKTYQITYFVLFDEKQARHSLLNALKPVEKKGCSDLIPTYRWVKQSPFWDAVFSRYKFKEETLDIKRKGWKFDYSAPQYTQILSLVSKEGYACCWMCQSNLERKNDLI